MALRVVLREEECLSGFNWVEASSRRRRFVVGSSSSAGCLVGLWEFPLTVHVVIISGRGKLFLDEMIFSHSLPSTCESVGGVFDIGQSFKRLSITSSSSLAV